MKILKRTTIVLVCISAIYLAMEALLSQTELSFLSWVKVMGQTILGIFTPMSALAWALASLYRRERVHQAVKAVCITASVIVYCIYICFASFFILLGSEEERMLTRHLLVTNESFLDETRPVYYHRTAFLFKRPGKITPEDKAEYLEKKYNRNFQLSKEGNTFYDVDMPEIRVSVKQEGMSLTDNYVSMVTLHFLVEAYRSYGMERPYHVIKEKNGFQQYFCMEATDGSDILDMSIDISELIGSVWNGDENDYLPKLYKEHSGSVYFSFEGSTEAYTGHISFGGPGSEQMIDVEELVLIAYNQEFSRRSEEEALKDAQSQQENAAENSSAESMTEAETEPEPEMDHREVAAKLIYDKMLAEDGFSYEVCYNAKGNLYIDLGMKEVGRYTYSYRLVYDRPSQNGACELFVLYRSVEGDENEEIVDMYAVETATEKVAASGRKAWSDVGSQEYREMTGE